MPPPIETSRLDYVKMQNCDDAVAGMGEEFGFVVRGADASRERSTLHSASFLSPDETKRTPFGADLTDASKGRTSIGRVGERSCATADGSLR